MINDYPENWVEIALQVKRENNFCCERCKHAHDVAAGYMLTVHHLDMDKANCARWNLAALCQRCHLHITHKVKMDQMFFNFLEVSDWFKPHLEGYLKSKGKKKNERKIQK